MSDYSNTFGGAAKDSANSTILGADHDTQYSAIATMSATKANKVASPTSGNLLKVDGNGDLVDSGIASTRVTTAAEKAYLASLLATGVTDTEFDYLDGVTSNIQSQLNAVATPALAQMSDSNDQTAGSGLKVMTFAGSDFDSASIADLANNRFIVPSGYTKARLHFCCRCYNASTVGGTLGQYVESFIDSSEYVTRTPWYQTVFFSGNTTFGPEAVYLNYGTGWIDCVAGEVFTAKSIWINGGSDSLIYDWKQFSIELMA